MPISRDYGRGATCSADGMRFYVPTHILAADYSHVLEGRDVTLYAHTSDNFLRMHQQPIPCRLREAAYSLDGLMEPRPRRSARRASRQVPPFPHKA
jgi:TnpA family transposase